MRRVEFISNTAEAPVVPEPAVVKEMPKKQWTGEDEAIAEWSRRIVAQDQPAQRGWTWDRF